MHAPNNEQLRPQPVHIEYLLVVVLLVVVVSMFFTGLHLLHSKCQKSAPTYLEVTCDPELCTAATLCSLTLCSQSNCLHLYLSRFKY